MQQPIVIIGAGPAGLTAAYQLTRRFANVLVLEAGSRVGGFSQSIDIWGQRVDLGPHRFFSDDLRINQLWLEIAGSEYGIVDRLTRIYYRGRLFHYPLRAGNALAKLGIAEASRCLASYAWGRLNPPLEDGSFESWVQRRFGRRLYEIFFKAYTEKLWGVPCTELDADFAAQRIKRFSLGEAVRSALLPSRKVHKTLVDQFAYPVGGTGRIYEKMAASVQANGGILRLNTPVRAVLTEGHTVVGVELENGEHIATGQVISSMPLTVLAERLPEAPPEVVASARKLAFRNTVLVYVRVPNPNLFPDQWLYVNSPELRIGRITNFRNWHPSLTQGQPDTILCLEMWCNTPDPEWDWTDEQWSQVALADLARTGLCGAHTPTHTHVVRLARTYPLYSKGYRDTLAPMVQYVQQVQGLQAIGRYGSFKYNNQDHSLLMGMLAAENVLDTSVRHNLWDINTDFAYQERATITRAGLVKG